MASVTFKVEGLDKLQERLLQLNEKVQKKLGNAAVGAAARSIRDQAKANVRRQSVDTGSLEGSIIAKRMKADGDLAALFIVTPRTKKTGSKKSRAKQKTAPHARFVEFGTVNMTPEPFLEPALRHGAGKAIKIITERLEKGLIREANKK